MIYEANSHPDKGAGPNLIELDFGIIDLIKKNEKGSLHEGNRLIPFILRTLEGAEHFTRGTMMSLPGGGDCFYSFTDPESKNYVSGGFLYDTESLYFVEKLINLNEARDEYRQRPPTMFGNYATNLSFEEIIRSFQESNFPLFRTIKEGHHYEKSRWPEDSIPNLGEMSYDEAFEILKNK